MGIIIIFPPMFRTNSNVFLDNVEAGGGGGSFVHFSCNWGLFGVIFGANPCLDIVKITSNLVGTGFPYLNHKILIALLPFPSAGSPLTIIII